jgi:hypothetical protein
MVILRLRIYIIVITVSRIEKQIYSTCKLLYVNEYCWRIYLIFWGIIVIIYQRICLLRKQLIVIDDHKDFQSILLTHLYS